MSEPEKRHSRAERLIEAMDRPLLVLAVVTMLLYLLDLRGMLGSAQGIWMIVTLLIDLVFVFDLVLKLHVYGTSYLHTPWFLIDLISCLPIIDALATGVRPIRAVRFVRAFRFLRILRGLRILRALRSIPAFEEFMKDVPHTQRDQALHRYMNFGLVGLTVTVLIFIIISRKKMENDHIARIDEEIRTGMNVSTLRILDGYFRLPPNDDPYVVREVTIAGRPRTIYFDMESVEERSDAVEFFLILGMMLSMLFLMYIIAYHQLDVTQAQLRTLLNLALPKQVAEQFLVDPNAYGRKSRMAATILFMDFVGFTETCEQLAHDPDKLSSHLEAAMDRLVGDLVKHDMIIDKFIGDAIMSFRGGTLVSGDLKDHAYRAVRAALDSTRSLAQLNDPYFHRVKIGGASADDCLIGAFGTSVRLSYTILGDAVNLAARLEPASRQCGTRNLFCEYTYELCAERSDIAWRRWGRIRVVGKSTPVDVYEAFATECDEDLSFITTFHLALDAFEANEFARARELFEMADSSREGGDEPSQSYAQWCDKLLRDGLPANWEPVLDTHK